MIFVKPVKGALVRRPDQNYRPVKTDGELVPNTAYFRRSIKRGELIETKPATKKKVAKNTDQSEVNE